MKITIITSVRNNLTMLKEAIASVASQKDINIEHLIIDGNSSDGTKEFLAGLKMANVRSKSEPDKSIYDALNKGLKEATGDIVGLLHSDDLFADDRILNDVHALFAAGADVVYGDLKYVDRSDVKKVIRHWRSGVFRKESLEFGWMPPHPAFFFRRKLLEQVGQFSLEYRIAADYEHMLRFLTIPELKVQYLPRVVTLMRLGGESNKSLKNILNKSSQDYAISKKFFRFPLVTLICKNLRKVSQFVTLRG